MNRGLTLIGGIGLGAGLMYVLDPDRGRRRRARMRDKAARTISLQALLLSEQGSGSESSTRRGKNGKV